MGFDPKKQGKGGKAGRNTDVDTLARAFAESESGDDREPMFDARSKPYRVKFLGAEQKPAIMGKNEWVVVKLKCVGADKKHGERAALYCISSKALAQSMKRLKTLPMALLGITDLDEYNQFDPDGSFFSALLGKKNGKSKKAAKCTGVEILAKVRRGGDTDDGDYFRNVTFAALDEDDTDDGEDDEDESPESERDEDESEDEDSEDEEEDEDEDEAEEEEDEDERPAKRGKASKKDGKRR